MKNSHNSEIINLLIQKKQSIFFFLQVNAICFHMFQCIEEEKTQHFSKVVLLHSTKEKVEQVWNNDIVDNFKANDNCFKTSRMKMNKSFFWYT